MDLVRMVNFNLEYICILNGGLHKIHQSFKIIPFYDHPKDDRREDMSYCIPQTEQGRRIMAAAHWANGEIGRLQSENEQLKQLCERMAMALKAHEVEMDRMSKLDCDCYDGDIGDPCPWCDASIGLRDVRRDILDAYEAYKNGK